MGVVLRMCCISIVLTSGKSYLLMGSSPILKLVLRRMLFCWLCLVRRVGGNSLILGMIVAVSGSVELESPVMPVSLWDLASFLVLRRLFHER